MDSTGQRRAVPGEVRVKAAATVGVYHAVEAGAPEAGRATPLPRCTRAQAETPLVLVGVGVRPVTVGENTVEHLPGTR